MFFSQPIRFPDHFLRITAHLDNPDGITFRRRSRFQLIIKRQGIVGNTFTKMKRFIFVLK